LFYVCRLNSSNRNNLVVIISQQTFIKCVCVCVFCSRWAEADGKSSQQPWTNTTSKSG